MPTLYTQNPNHKASAGRGSGGRGSGGSSAPPGPAIGPQAIPGLYLLLLLLLILLLLLLYFVIYVYKLYMLCIIDNDCHRV
jgi:hypothetical protein